MALGHTRTAVNSKVEQTCATSKTRAILTNRQIEVAVQTAGGFTNAEIAEYLCLQESSVTTYQKAIHRRLGIASRTQLVIFCYENNLLPKDHNQKFRMELNA